MRNLCNNLLFEGIEDQKIKDIFSKINYKNSKFKKGDIIANEEEKCYYLGLIIEGEIEIQRIYPSGKYLVLKKLKAGDVFGEALIFINDSKYPATVVATSDLNIIFINKVEILKLFNTEQKVLENFMALLSNKVLMLNEKIKSISFKTVREKVVNYLLEESNIQKSNNIILRDSKENIAALLGIPRPSFSRELIKLKDMGYIEYDRKNIYLLKISELEEELYN